MVISVPDLVATAPTATLYDDAAVDEVKDKMGAVKFIDKSAQETTLAKTDYTLTAPDTVTAGENEYTVSYNGYSTKVKINLTATTVDSLEVATEATKKLGSYTTGDALALDGLVINAVKNSGKKAAITDYTIKLGSSLADAAEISKTKTLKVADSGKHLYAVKDGKSVDLGALTVAAKQITVPTVSGSYTYNGSSQSVTLTNPDAASITLSGTQSGTAAGSYTVTAALNDKAETVWKDKGTTEDQIITWQIASKTDGLTAELSDSTARYYYDGSEKKPAVTVKDGSTALKEGTDYTLSYQNNVNVGTAAKVIVSYIGNYAGKQEVTFTINKTQATKTDFNFTLPQNPAYDGSAKAATAAVKSGVIGMGTPTVQYSADGKTWTADAPKNAGTYQVGITLTEGTNYAAETTPLYVGSFTIAKKELTFTVGVQKKTYNGKTNDPVISVSFDGLVSGESLTADTDYKISASYANANAGDAVSVTGSLALKDTAKANNYYIADANKGISTTGKVDPTETTLTLTAANADYTGKCYDYANIGKTSNVEDAVSYKFYQDNNNSKGAALDATPTNVGTYWVEGKIAETTNATAAEYEVKFSINKKELTASAVVADKTYNGETGDPAFGISFAGLVNGETLATTTDFTIESKAYTSANAGDQTVNITVKLADSATAKNYSLKSENISAIGKINKADVTLTITAPDTVFTGSAYASATNVITPGGLTVSYRYYSDSECQNELSVVPVNAGTYYAKAVFAGSDNYNAKTTAADEFKITKAPIGATYAAAIDMFYGDTAARTLTPGDFKSGENALPTNGGTYTVSGATNQSDTNNILASASGSSFQLASGLSSADADKTATFDVTIGSTNYADFTAKVTVKVINISVNWPTLTMQQITYGQTNTALFPTFDMNGTATTTETINGTFSIKNPDAKPDAGTTSAVLVFTPNSGSGVSGSFEKTYTCPAVKKADLTVTPDAGQKKTYGSADPAAFTYTSKGAITGQTAAFSGKLSRAAGYDVGSYSITAGTLALIDNGGFKASNYSLKLTEDVKFAIEAKALADSMIAAISKQTYSGSALQPAVSVSDSAATLTSLDYSVAYSNNTNAGTATVTLTGKNNYKGTATASFTIDPKALTQSMLAAVTAQTYSGSALTPAPVVTDGTKTLTANTDYTVSYSTNTDIGTAGVYVTGKGNYSGTISTTFTINQKALDAAMIADIAAVDYSGLAYTPAPVLSYNSKTLASGTDYSVAYANNVNAGTATVTVTGMGNFSGSAQKTFTINKKALSESMIEELAALTYSGSALTPAPVVKNGSVVLVAGTDYSVSYDNNVNAGSAAVTVTGKGNYSGSVQVSFTILPLPVVLDWGTVSFKYDGTEKSVSAVVSNKAVGDEVEAVVTGGKLTKEGSTVAVVNTLTGEDAANYTLTGSTNRSMTVTVTPALESIVIEPATLKAELSELTLTVSGYRKDDETVTVNGETVSEGKVTISGVEFTVDEKNVTIQPSNVNVKEPEAAPEIPAFEELKEEVKEAGITKEILESLTTDAPKSEGLDTAAASVMNEIAKNLPAGADKVEISFSIKMEPKAAVTTPTDTEKPSLTLEIQPQVNVQYKTSGGANVGGSETQEIKNEDIKTEIVIKVNMPEFLEIVSLFAKHTKHDGTVEYLECEVINGVVSFKMNSFSEVQLLNDTRTATVTNIYTSTGAESAEIIYTAADIGKALPVDEMEGYTFKGWQLSTGSDLTVYTTVTEELLTAIDGQEVSFVSVFEQNKGGYIIGGVTTSYTISAETTEGGSITPVGNVSVGKNGSKTYTITAAEGYELKQLLVDGKEVELTDSYTFEKVTGNHSIKAVFAKKEAPKMNFADVKEGAWYYDAVRYAFENGLMKGTDLGFEPLKTTTRAELAMMLFRLAGEPEVNGENRFSDVKEGAWYYDAVLWAAANGVVNGNTDGTFRPNTAVTREQFAAMFYRYVKAAGKDVSVGEDTNILSYNDAFDISEYAIPAFQWACGAGLFRGDELGNLNPGKDARRAETATIFMRYCKAEEEESEE